MSGTSSARRAIPVLVEVVRRCEPWRQLRGQPVGARGEEPSYGEDVSGGGRRLESQQSSERADDRARSPDVRAEAERLRSEEHTSELQSLMCTSSAVFCLQKTTNTNK